MQDAFTDLHKWQKEIAKKVGAAPRPGACPPLPPPPKMDADRWPPRVVLPRSRP